MLVAIEMGIVLDDGTVPGVVVADLAVVVEVVDVVDVVAVVVVALEGVVVLVEGVVVVEKGDEVVVVAADFSVGPHHFSPPVLTLRTVGAVISPPTLGGAEAPAEMGALKPPRGADDGFGDGLRPRRRLVNSAKLRSEYLLSPTA